MQPMNMEWQWYLPICVISVTNIFALPEHHLLWWKTTALLCGPLRHGWRSGVPKDGFTTSRKVKLLAATILAIKSKISKLHHH